MPIVVVDTNILAGSPRLRSQEWLSLIENKNAWGVEFAVPEVVFMETANVVRRQWSSQRDQLAKAKVGEFGLSDALDLMLAEINRCSDEYEQSLRDLLGEIDASIVPPPATDLMVLAGRAAAQRAPYSNTKDKDGFRDTLIWLTVLSIAEDNPDTEVWFVSDNHVDFGPKVPNWTGDGTGERDDCPILFHQDLRDDLDERGLSGRVNYVVSLKRLEQYFAAQFAPIPEAKLANLVDQIDTNQLAGRLMMAALGRPVDPEQGALPLDAATAEIVAAREQHRGWEFSEGAGRGDAGWTARFAVDAEVDIEFIRGDLSRGEETKRLRFFGDITVSLENQVLGLVVTSAEALPDDPMRARWVRRADRTRSTGGSTDPLWGLPFGSVSAAFANEQNRAFAEALRRSQPRIDLGRSFEELRKVQQPSADVDRAIEEARKVQQPSADVDRAIKEARKVQKAIDDVRRSLPPGFR
ncbi:PIN domain-containing protein [Nocardia fluminea]|uniref:PIN domain-containing protein n=1 Tax=Nocardia fluminea TaxID=134984 RepID=UPI0036547C6C